MPVGTSLGRTADLPLRGDARAFGVLDQRQLKGILHGLRRWYTLFWFRRKYQSAIYTIIHTCRSPEYEVSTLMSLAQRRFA